MTQTMSSTKKEVILTFDSQKLDTLMAIAIEQKMTLEYFIKKCCEKVSDDMINSIKFETGYVYKKNTKKLYKPNGSEPIKFTRLEDRLFAYLCSNLDRYVNEEEIAENVWKNKSMSVFTLRNMVSNIRNKTYYGIIINKSSHGYRIQL